jgi:hypothetical protein
MKPSKEYTTHMPTLLVALKATTGLVIEVGGGQSSTPLLHWMCKLGNRKLITYENHPDYYAYAKKFQSNLHRVRKIENWDDMPIEKAGVVFIDHHPSSRRSVDTVRFKDADIVVIHDTEREDENYRNSEIWPHFKYRHTYKDARPWTTMVSNKVDVTKLQYEL